MMRKISKLPVVLIVLLLFSAGAAFAQGAGTELDLFEEIPVVYSASKIEESILDAPAAISVISSDDLSEWGIVDLPDAFRRVPGVDVVAFDGGVWGVSARGYNERWSRRMLVLMDGMSVYTPLFSGVRWGMLPLLIDDIDRIEVVRGANDTLYGFNAFNGVVNIKTKDPSETYGFFGKYVYGSQNRNEFTARYGNRLSLGGAGDLDYRIAYSKDAAQAYGIKRGNEFSDKRDLNTIIAKARYIASDTFNVEAMFGMKTGLKNEGPVTQTGGTYKAFRTFDYQQVKINAEINDDHKAYLQLYRWKYNQDGKRQVNNLDVNDVKEVQYDIEFQDSFSLFDGKSRTVLGASYRHNTVEFFRVKTNTDTNIRQPVSDDLVSAFINEKLILLEDAPGIKRLTAVGGLRAEWSHLIRDTELAPRASLLYSPVENNTLRATYARGYRLPSFVEEFNTNFVVAGEGNVLRLMGNQQLKPEVVDSYELGYSAYLWDGKMGLDVDTFWAYYRNMIGSNQSQAFAAFPVAQPQVIEFNNEQSSQSWGFEVAGEVHPLPWMDLYTNYTFEAIKDGYNNPNTIQHEGGTPISKLNVGVTLDFEEDSIENMPYLDGLTLNVNANYRSGYTFFNNNDAPRSAYNIKPHTRLDFAVTKAFFDDSVKVSFIGNNLIGDGNNEARWVQVPQAYYLTVTLNGWPWELWQQIKNDN